MKRKVRTRAESGTCNVCATPCSSCMHLRRMGSKGNEFSDETSRVTATTQYSVNEDDALPSLKNKTHESPQPTTSEASNLLSVNSSHDSLSENAESKENIRSSDTAEASLESDKPLNLCSGGNVVENQISPKLLCGTNQITLSNKNEDFKGVEGHDDNISSVVKANDANLSVSYHNKDVGRKNLLCSSAVVSSLVTERYGKADLVEYPRSDANAGFSSQKVPKNYLPPVENINLSLLKGTACKIVSDNNSSAHNGADDFPNGKSTPIRDTSGVSTPKLEEETNKDGEQSDDVLNCSDQVEQGEKLNESAESPDTEEPLMQHVSGDESDESEIMEHDVKVCDICGDAGREDMLAICCRCSDGAEHTYCMRVMLLKVPEGDWLCEECKLAEETENQKQGSDTEGKSRNKASAQSSGKRLVETIGLSSASLKRGVETSLGSPKSSSSNKIGTLSRNSSFNGTDKGKVKPANQTSFGDHSSIHIPENVRSHSTGPRLQNSKSILLKSSSFNSLNSKPKIKLVDEVPPKPKGVRDGSSVDMKDGPPRMISKSMSFKSVNSSRSNATESKVKMLSPKFSHIQDIKGVKQFKDRSAFERKNLSKLERPLASSLTTNSNTSTPNAEQKLTPRGESVTVSSASNHRESKGALSRSSSCLARKGGEIPVTSVRASSANGMSVASVDQKLNLVSPKEEPSSSSSWTAEKPSNNASEHFLDGLPRRELQNQVEKTRETSVTRLRPCDTAGLKSITCQKCKEVGHAAESCTLTIARASFMDSFSARSIREDVSTGSKLKAAIDAAMLKKPGICKKKKLGDQSDGLSTYNGDVSCEIASQDHFPVLNKMQNVLSDEDTREMNSDFGSSVPAVGKFGRAPAAASGLLKMSAIPEHEYIWQGAFEVHSVGKPLDFYAGIQAHLSTCASPKVLQVVNKFPQKVTFDEVPRLSTWPRQFHDNGVMDDNIALYFFAKDIDSYEKYYRGLLDNMIKKDLALKGSFDGVELLIFASTQLPEYSQRWNMLFFMWGVFRGRRSHCSNSMEKSIVPSMSVVPLDKEIHSVVSASENDGLTESEDKETTVYDSSCNMASELNSSIKSNGDPGKKASSTHASSEKQDSKLDFKPLSKIATSNELLCKEVKCTSSSVEEVGLLVMRQDPGLKPSVRANGTKNGSSEGEAIEKHGDASHVKILGVGNPDLCVKGSDKEKVVDGMGSDRGELVRDLNDENVMVDAEAHLKEGDLTVKEINCWQSYNRKRPYLDLSDTAPQNSGSTNHKTLWNKVDNTLVNGESIGKKLKTGVSEPFGFSSLKDGNSRSDGLCSHIGDLGSSSSEEMMCDKVSDKKVIFEDSRTTEMSFFPLGLPDAKDLPLGSSSKLWRGYSSNNEDRLLDGTPNLELALGAETKSQNRGIRSLLGENNVLNKKTVDKATDKEEDGVSASLSLSLSFPFSDKETSVKPVSKPEQILQGRPRVNTSLLLFGGFSDK